jgi:hypothetical protein
MDWGSVGSGAVSGASTGSIFGPWGAAAGGVLGALGGGIFGGKDKKPKIKNYPLYNPEQMKLIGSYNQGASELNPEAFDYIKSILSNDPKAFEDFERPMMEQFNTRTVPQLAERFSGIGARDSSAFNQSLAQAGRGLSGDLATMRANLRDSAMNKLMQYNNLALTQTTSPYMQEGKQSALNAMVPGAATNLANAAKGWNGEDMLWDIANLFDKRI